jgi:hypothetical protein
MIIECQKTRVYTKQIMKNVNLTQFLSVCKEQRVGLIHGNTTLKGDEAMEAIYKLFGVRKMTKREIRIAKIKRMFRIKMPKFTKVDEKKDFRQDIRYWETIKTYTVLGLNLRIYQYEIRHDLERYDHLKEGYYKTTTIFRK